MNSARRAFLALFSLAVIAACAGLLMLAWGDRQLDLSSGNWHATGAIATGGNARVLFTVICGAVIALALAGLVAAVAPDRDGRRESLRLNQADGSKVRISPEALERLLREQLERLPEVVSAEPHVRLRGRMLATRADVAIRPGTSIAHATSEVANTTSQVYRELVGVTSADRPEISVHYADPSAEDAGRNREELIGEPMKWPDDDQRRRVEHSEREAAPHA
jgi:hypothetical protein